jgi:hypothetical protein
MTPNANKYPVSKTKFYLLKANGGTTAKVFKWKKTTLAPQATLKATRKHAFRKITTRVYYPGTHKLEILINGISLGIKNFKLIR